MSGFSVVLVAGLKVVFVTTFRVTQFRVTHFTLRVIFSQLAQYDFNAGFRVVCINFWLKITLCWQLNKN